MADATNPYVTADQLVWLIEHIIPNMPPHGPDWMTGMWHNDGVNQSSDATIIKWNLPDIPQPDQATLMAKWKDPAIQTSYAAYTQQQLVPVSIGREQAMIYLMQNDKWQAVLDYVATITNANEKIVANVAINSTSKWNRNSPFLNAAATAIGLTSDQIDQMFIAAAQITI